MGPYKITKENLLDILKWSGFTLECVRSDHGDYHAEDSYAWTRSGIEVSTDWYTIDVYADPNSVLTEDDERLRFDEYPCDAIFELSSGNTSIKTKNFELFVSILESECKLEYEERFPLLNKLFDKAIETLNMKSCGHNKTSIEINGYTRIIENTPKALETIQNFCKLFLLGKHYEI